MSVSEIIRTKRDVREFSSQPVSKEDKLAILEAARMAGSGLNSQHWRLYSSTINLSSKPWRG